MNLQTRVLVGRNAKLQALLFMVVACCMMVFVYGLYTYTDAPYKECIGGPYCGKTGEHHSYEIYAGWKRWERTLFVCWPFGILASIGLRRLRRKPVVTAH